MSVFDWSGAIKITFDKEIINDPEIAELSVQRVYLAGAAAHSSYYSGGYEGSKAFDANESTFWMTTNTTNQWIQQDGLSEITLSKIRVLNHETYRAKNIEIRGSHNNVDWTTIATGVLPSSGRSWTDFNFEATTYRYWRIFVVNVWSNFPAIVEVQFFGPVATYQVNGWAVSAQEYDTIPGGNLQTKTYILQKVTKTLDNLSIILWLKLANRMLYPQGQVTVNYDKETGNLIGAGNVPVEDFTISFTPANITPVFNPHDSEHISLSVSTTAVRVAIAYLDAKADEHISLTISATATRYHVNDIQQ